MNWSVDLLVFLHATQCQHFYTLYKCPVLGASSLNAFNQPWMYQMSYMFLHPAIDSLVLSKFLTEHVTDQFTLLILMAPCWMEAPWLPTVLNMLADIPYQCFIVRDLVMNVSVGWVLKDLPLLHLTLWLLRNVMHTDKGSLPQYVRHWPR